MQKIIGVLSGKGGVGKTVTAINLSAALHEFGQETTVVDADISSANLTIHLGLPDAAVCLQDVLDKRSNIYNAVRVVPKGLRIIPASVSIEKGMADMSRLKEVLRGELSGFIVVDSPPGFGKDIYHILEACDDVLVVTNPDVPSVTDAVKMVKIARKVGKNNLSIVMTRVERTKVEVSPAEVESVCEAPVIGMIPEDKTVKKAIFERMPVVFHSPYSKATIHYKHLAARVAGIDYNPPSMLALRRLLS